MLSTIKQQQHNQDLKMKHVSLQTNYHSHLQSIIASDHQRQMLMSDTELYSSMFQLTGVFGDLKLESMRCDVVRARRLQCLHH